MSFLTLFTSDAAAAHGHEFSPAPILIEKDTNICDKETSTVTMVREEPKTKTASTAKRPPRTKTTYHLAQPPPSAHHRHSLGSQRALLVQIQQLSKASRPIPVVDVMPAYFYGSKLKKFGQCFKNGISQQDLVLVASEEYDTKNGVSDDEDYSHSKRRLMGAVTQVNSKAHSEGGRKTTVISIGDGSHWEVNALASGGYEFVSHDEDGNMRIAKWLPKITMKRRSTVNGPATPDQAEERRFQFSISDPATRKRPIVAWMSHNNIEILDRYPRGNASGRGTPVASPRASAVDLTSPLSRESSYEDTSVEYTPISEAMKLLIIATGVWVTLRGRPHFGLTRPGELPTSPLSPTLRPNLVARATVATSAPRSSEPSPVDSLRHITISAGPSESETRPRRSVSLHGPSLTRGIDSLSRSLGRRPTSNLYEAENETRKTSRPVTPDHLRPASCILPKGVIPDLESVGQNGQPNRQSVSLPNSPTRGRGLGRADPARRSQSYRLSLGGQEKNKEKEKRKRGFRNMVSTIFRRSTIEN